MGPNGSRADWVEYRYTVTDLGISGRDPLHPNISRPDQPEIPSGPTDLGEVTVSGRPDLVAAFLATVARGPR